MTGHQLPGISALVRDGEEWPIAAAVLTSIDQGGDQVARVVGAEAEPRAGRTIPMG